MTSRHAAIELDYGGGTYTFRLGLEQIEEIERLCEKSIFEIARGLAQATAPSRQIVEVIRCGLIGGGMAPSPALDLTRKRMDELSLDNSRDVACAVALAGLARLDRSDLEAAAAEEPAPTKKAAAAEANASTSPRSEATPS